MADSAFVPSVPMTRAELRAIQRGREIGKVGRRLCEKNFVRRTYSDTSNRRNQRRCRERMNKFVSSTAHMDKHASELTDDICNDNAMREYARGSDSDYKLDMYSF